jgi:hypothetical protein
MRRFIVAAAVLFGSIGVTAPSDMLPFTGTAIAAQQYPAPPSTPPAEPSGPSQPAAQPTPAPPQPAPQVNVEVRDSGWYASPTWIAIGAIGLVVLILVVAMASRTGSNTVIRG